MIDDTDGVVVESGRYAPPVLKVPKAPPKKTKDVPIETPAGIGTPTSKMIKAIQWQVKKTTIMTGQWTAVVEFTGEAQLDVRASPGGKAVIQDFRLPLKIKVRRSQANNNFDNLPKTILYRRLAKPILLPGISRSKTGAINSSQTFTYIQAVAVTTEKLRVIIGRRHEEGYAQLSSPLCRRPKR